MASTLKINNIDTASGTTITIPSGKTLTSTDTPIIGVGNVVQVVTHTYSTAFSWNSSGLHTATTISFTPKTSTNKIHLIGTAGHYSASDANAWSGTWTSSIFVGGSKVFETEHSGIITGNVNFSDQHGFNCPIATNATAGSALTIDYKVNLTSGTATHQLNRSPRTTEFIIFEIAQ